MAGLINAARLPTPDEMEKMSWSDLYMLRIQNRGDAQAQKILAPFEHQAYAREQVSENPITAPVWAVMPAAYQAAKAVGLTGPGDDMSTPASLDQATAGMKGVWQGVKDAWNK